MTYVKEKQQILTNGKLKLEDVWHFCCLKNDDYQNSCSFKGGIFMRVSCLIIPLASKVENTKGNKLDLSSSDRIFLSLLTESS